MTRVARYWTTPKVKDLTVFACLGSPKVIGLGSSNFGIASIFGVFGISVFIT